MPPSPLGHEQRGIAYNEPQVGVTSVIHGDFHARTDLSKTFNETDVWYVAVAFNVRCDDKRSDEELLRLSVSVVRRDYLREIRQKHGHLGGRVPKYVQFVIHRDNPPDEPWRGVYTTATISPLSDLFDTTITPEEFLERAVVRTPKEPTPGEWYVDMAVEHYNREQGEKAAATESEEVAPTGRAQQ